MPKVDLVFWDRRGRLADESRLQFESSGATIHDVADEREFLSVLQRTTCPAVILGRTTVGDKIADAISAAAAKDGWIIIVGRGCADEQRRDLDLGARLFLDETTNRRVWIATVHRLLNSLQDRLQRRASSTL
jgi:hypothetical protein